jgi:arylsulfatase A-like enzyme
MVDEAVAFVRTHREQPWFINLWLDDTHTPFRPSEEQLKNALQGIGTPEFRAVLFETDRQIGRLLDGLRDAGAEDNTIVILAGDNGPQPSFARARTNGLRGMKWSLYEGGIRTPLIVRWPGVIPEGAVNDRTVIAATDLLPTLCSLTEVPAPEGIEFDGEDLSTALKGQKQIRTKPLFWEYGRKPAEQGEKGLRAFPYPGEPESKSPNVAMRDGDWKLLINADGSSVELYNLKDDVVESVNVAEKFPEVIKQMSDAALNWRRSLP